MGVSVPDDLRRFIGPPLLPAMMEFCGMDKETAEKALVTYRVHYSDHGMYDAYLYDGVREMLDRLKEKGHKLYIGTSKPESFAVKMLEALGVSEYFTIICGAIMDTKRNRKADVLAELFRRIGSSPQDEGTDGMWCMIGDRIYDAEGAAEFGMPCIGVLWGFGSAEEFTGCTIVKTPAELTELF
ncbi:MAG: HAD hydrolase-like protein [Clostridia bacterium]|nr:HAD hydrolase-like protein [Clostridia bacterium]